MQKVLTFNTFDQDQRRGWFLGHFARLPELTVEDVAAQLVRLTAGTRKRGTTLQKQAKSLVILLEGAMEVSFPAESRTARLDKVGDAVFFAQGVPHSWQCLEDALVMTIRWPSLEDDVETISDK